MYRHRSDVSATFMSEIGFKNSEKKTINITVIQKIEKIGHL